MNFQELTAAGSAALLALETEYANWCDAHGAAVVDPSEYADFRGYMECGLTEREQKWIDQYMVRREAETWVSKGGWWHNLPLSPDASEYLAAKYPEFFGHLSPQAEAEDETTSG